MEIQTIDNHVFKRKLNLDLTSIKQNTHFIYNFVKDNLADKSLQEQRGEIYMMAIAGNKYNAFNFNFPELNKLLDDIRETYYYIAGSEEASIKCWINFYNRHQFTSWHEHGSQMSRIVKKVNIHNTWHGFFCVDVEPSVTTYQFLDTGRILEVQDEDNLLVMSRNGNDRHRTWPWPYDRTRITMAFNIAPSKHFNPPEYEKNIWVKL
jgi:hypothetical protein